MCVYCGDIESVHWLQKCEKLNRLAHMCIVSESQVFSLRARNVTGCVSPFNYSHFWSQGVLTCFPLLNRFFLLSNQLSVLQWMCVLSDLIFCVCVETLAL